MNDTSGLIYFIESDGLYKIGLTSDVENRLRSLRRKSPSLRLLWTVFYDDVLKAEQEWHGRFAGCRVKGEWFALSREDLNHAIRLSIFMASQGQSVKWYEITDEILSIMQDRGDALAERVKAGSVESIVENLAAHFEQAGRE
jgi:hypothetical protein